MFRLILNGNSKGTSVQIQSRQSFFAKPLAEIGLSIANNLIRGHYLGLRLVFMYFYHRKETKDWILNSILLHQLEQKRDFGTNQF
jgi:hypothetical protein